jgi:hypothetical protein
VTIPPALKPGVFFVIGQLEKSYNVITVSVQNSARKIKMSEFKKPDCLKEVLKHILE